MRFRALLFVVLCLSFAVSHAQVIWDESIDGDISGDRLNPDFVTLAAGNNILIASSSEADKEYIRLDVPTGHVLSAIILDNYVSDDGLAFMGVQAGTTFTEPADSPSVGNILGYVLFGWGSSTVGTDVLDDMGSGPGAIGFTPPLASGPYTYWIQQLGEPTDYQFNFVVTPVPEPATFCALGLGALALLRRRRTR